MKPTAQKEVKAHRGYKQAGSFQGNSQDRRPPQPNRPKHSRETEWEQVALAEKDEIEQLVEVLKAVKSGDFSVRFDYEKGDILGRVGELLNDIIGLNEHLSNELVRVGKIVGQEGRMTERASVGPAKGSWATIVNSVNQLIGDLVAPTN